MRAGFQRFWLSALAKFLLGDENASSKIPHGEYVCREAEHRQNNSSACCNKDGGTGPPGLSYRREPQTTFRCRPEMAPLTGKKCYHIILK